MKKIKLEIIALSSSATQHQSYAVVLGELDGIRKLPIVIGAFEAQAIVVTLEKIKPTRPLTHDLFYSFLLAFNIELTEVIIHKLEEGIFYAKLICRSNNKIIEIDSRTSDALALAVRIKCPIYTYEHILETAGLSFEGPDLASAHPKSQEKINKEETDKTNLESLSLTELNTLLDEILENEDYAQAIAIRDEINRRENK